MKKSEPHEHNHTELDFMRVVGTNRIILGYRCSCGDFQAFEMGSKDDMRELYRCIEEGKRNANRSIQGREGGMAGKGQTNRPRTAQA